MLIKVNGVLMSAAPAEGESGGSAGGESASADTGGNETGGEGGGEDGSGEGETGGGESAAQDTGDGQGDLTNDFDFDSFLAYDPFNESKANSGKPGKTGNEDQGDGQGPANSQGDEKLKQTGQGDQKPAESKDQQPGQKEKENPEMALLRDQVQQLTQLLNQVQQNAGQPAAGQQQQPVSDEAKKQARQQEVLKNVPQYQMQVPDSIMQKMGSDDPNTIRAGLAEFAQGVASVTHYNVVLQLEERLEALEKQLIEKSVETFRTTTQAEETEKKQRSAVYKDFYGKFPELDKPELQLFVQTQAKMLAQQYGVNQWNEKFRDALGEHVKRVLGMSQQGPQPNADGSQGNGQEQKPGVRFNSGSGQGRSNKAASEVDDIASTLLG